MLYIYKYIYIYVYIYIILGDIILDNKPIDLFLLELFKSSNLGVCLYTGNILIR